MASSLSITLPPLPPSPPSPPSHPTTPEANMTPPHSPPPYQGEDPAIAELRDEIDGQQQLIIGLFNRIPDLLDDIHLQEDIVQEAEAEESTAAMLYRPSHDKHSLYTKLSTERVRQAAERGLESRHAYLAFIERWLAETRVTVTGLMGRLLLAHQQQLPGMATATSEESPNFVADTHLQLATHSTSIQKLDERRSDLQELVRADGEALQAARKHYEALPEQERDETLYLVEWAEGDLERSTVTLDICAEQMDAEIEAQRELEALFRKHFERKYAKRNLFAMDDDDDDSVETRVISCQMDLEGDDDMRCGGFSQTGGPLDDGNVDHVYESHFFGHTQRSITLPNGDLEMMSGGDSDDYAPPVITGRVRLVQSRSADGDDITGSG